MSLLLGLTIGLAAITKPTYQWLVLAVAAPLAYPVVQRLRRDRLWWATLLKMALATVLVLSSALGVVETTKQMNQRTYHVNLVEDLSSGALARVWKLWASVEAGRPEKYVPITKAMRTAVYRVSPAAAVLEPTLESPTDGFKLADCYSPLKICNEAGNWFEWDLREAVYSTGGVRSVRGLQTYLNRMADDIARACADGRLRCTSSPVLATGLPPFDAIPKGAVVSYTARGLWQMVWDQLPIRQIASSPATKAQYALWSSVVPSMPSLESLRKGQGVPAEDGVLRVMVALYGIFNMVLLATLCLGPGRWLLARLARRPRHRGAGLETATIATLFLLSTVVGMATLAVYTAALGPLGYTDPFYWTDFATPGELFLVFGAFASWSALTGQSPPVAADAKRRPRQHPPEPRLRAPVDLERVHPSGNASGEEEPLSLEVVDPP